MMDAGQSAAVTVAAVTSNTAAMFTTATAPPVWESTNGTTELPPNMTFNSGNVVSISCYSVLMAVSATGNFTVLYMILRKRGARSRINNTLMHLAIADLLVTFLMMPLEIAWAATVDWRGGDFMCRLMAVCRVFGLFLSSFILVCISMDRYFAILKPMNLSAVDRRGRHMLIAAWAMSFLCSMPQAMVFSVQRHPNITWYEQCITYGVLTTQQSQVMYAIFSSAFMYGLPLFIIIFAYGSILMEILRQSRQTRDDVFRRSSMGFLSRAKTRTLKMTVVIVLVFFMCWTPYNIMSVWYWFDKESAEKVDQRIQKGLFIFACTNSCMNPIVYGVFNIRRRGRGPGAANGGGQVRNRQRTFSSSGVHSTCSEDSRHTSIVLVNWSSNSLPIPISSDNQDGKKSALRHQGAIRNPPQSGETQCAARLKKWQNGAMERVQRCLTVKLTAAMGTTNTSSRILS